MAGGLMQLAAVGSQDLYLSGNPQMTFFKTVYKRHTNFAMEFMKLYFKPKQKLEMAQFTQGSVNIARLGDLVHDTYLVVDVPDIWGPYGSGFRWVDNLGYVIIRHVTLTIGGSEIDKQYGEWMFIWNELTLTKAKKEHLKAMTSVNQTPLYESDNDPSMAITTKHILVTKKTLLFSRKRLYIPLEFWFCTNPGLALPLIALQNHEVDINFEFSPVNHWFILGSQNMSPDKFFGQGGIGFPAILSNTDSTVVPHNQNWDQQMYNQYKTLGLNHTNVFNYFLNSDDNSIGIWEQTLYVEANYIFLDNEERDKFAKNSQEYLITQTQRREYVDLHSGPNNIWIKIDHPVKEFFWVFQREDASVYNDFFNFSSLLIIKSYLLQMKFIETIEQFMTTNFSSFLSGQISSGEGTQSSLLNDLFHQLLVRELNTNPNNITNDLINAMESCKILFNSKDRLTKKDHIFFEHLQPFKAHTGYSEYPGIYNYTFSIDPEKFQPSGACNMSRIDRFQMQFTLKPAYQIDLTYEDATHGFPITTTVHNNVNPGTNIVANYSHVQTPPTWTAPFVGGTYQTLYIGDEIRYNMHFYSTNYNVLRIVGGMGSIAFSN